MKINHNPNGKKGCQKHQDKIKELSKEIDKTTDEDSGKIIEAKEEYVVATPKGEKKFRMLDVAGVIENQNGDEVLVKLIQVGLSDSKDKPIKREQKAIEDIEKHTGKKVEFFDYLKNKKII